MRGNLIRYGIRFLAQAITRPGFDIVEHIAKLNLPGMMGVTRYMRALSHRAPLEKMADAEKLQDILETRLPLPPRGEPAAEEQVLAHVEMREEAPFLEHVADAPPVLRNEDAFLRVDEHPPLHGDTPMIRPHEAADGVHDRRLAGSRRAEKRGELSVRPEARMKVERTLRMPDVDVENH